jgi:hypothetical protein
VIVALQRNNHATLQRNNHATSQRNNHATMHHEEIELNFDASCQQIPGLESEILW